MGQYSTYVLYVKFTLSAFRGLSLPIHLFAIFYHGDTDTEFAMAWLRSGLLRSQPGQPHQVCKLRAQRLDDDSSLWLARLRHQGIASDTGRLTIIM